MASSTTLLVLLLITLTGHAIAQPGPPSTGPPSRTPISITVHANTDTAPAPSPTGPINITAILAKGGQFNTFIRLLTSTQAADQINNQVNNSQDGMTVFAPTDNAFMNLPAGYMNNLSNNQQVQLVQYHVLPKLYSLSDFQTVSNPVRTQASGQDGRPFGLYFSGEGNQVNVSSKLVTTQVNNALREQSPLAVYQIDKVLLPKEFTEAKAPSPSPATEKAAPADSATGPKAKSSNAGSTASGSGRLDIGLGLVAGVGLFCIGLLS